MGRLTKLRLIERNKLWLLSDISLWQKVIYYPQIVIAHLLYPITGRKKIRYLSEDFYFDNIATPLSLMTYPYELSRRIKDNINMELKTVLDIGGNIGQFSLTCLKVFRPEKIYVIEPNPDIFSILERNLGKNKSVELFNVGIGPEGSDTLFFEQNRSGLGSIIKDNAGLEDVVKGVTINLHNDVSAITGRDQFDLVKIDVEGYEFSLLSNLKKLRCRYLYIELSSGNRSLAGQHSETLAMIREKFGEFHIRHASEADARTPSFELLLEFT